MSESAQKIFDSLKDAEGKLFFDSSGKKNALSLMTPLTESEILSREKELGFSLPGLLRDLVKACSGVDGLLPSMDFSGQYGFEFELLPQGVPVAEDGGGNFWVLQNGAIYYASHDPPVLLWQADCLSSFIGQALSAGVRSAAETVAATANESALKVWDSNPGVISFTEAAMGDDELKEFSKALDPSYEIVDLRNASTGEGLSWGRYGNTTCKRFGNCPIFAYQKRKPSWIQKFFGSN